MLLPKKGKSLNQKKSNKKNKIEKNILINSKMDVNKYLEENNEFTDYDEVIEEDKRTFFEYYKDKIIDNQIIINAFFIKEETKPKSIKIALFILYLDLYLLMNGIFYSDSYISEIFNSTKKETLLSFISRSYYRFIYALTFTKIIEFITKFFLVENNEIRKILLRKRKNKRSLKNEILKLLKRICKKINILLVINYIIIIFSWYYISCFNNVYPNIKIEWIKSSLFIIFIVQILPFILGFFETCIRFISIKCNSEKLFKISLLLS